MPTLSVPTPVNSEALNIKSDFPVTGFILFGEPKISKARSQDRAFFFGSIFIVAATRA